MQGVKITYTITESPEYGNRYYYPYIVYYTVDNEKVLQWTCLAMDKDSAAFLLKRRKTESCGWVCVLDVVPTSIYD